MHQQEHLVFDISKTDIPFIDSQIRKALCNQDKSLRTSVQRLQWISKNSPMQSDRQIAESMLRSCKHNLQDAVYHFNLVYYSLRVDDILMEYNAISSKGRTNSFVVSKSAVLTSNERARMSKLKSDFIHIAGEYATITKLKRRMCEWCNHSEFKFNDDGMCVCKNCHAESDVIEGSVCFKDNERIKMTSRYKYTTQGYFIDAMNCIECKQNKDISSVLHVIQEEMKKQRKSVETITLQQMYAIILDLKLKDYYNDVYLIYFKITGKLIFDITSLRSELIEMHAQLDEAFDNVITDAEDDKAQNVYLKLFKLLQLLDYPCKRSDFFFLKDIDNENKHYRNWEKLIHVLNEKYPTTLTSKGKKRWRFIPSF